MKKIIHLNSEWKFSPSFKTEFIKRDFNDFEFETISIPHTNKQLPYNCFDEKVYQFTSCYRKTFFADADLKNNRFFIDFDGVMSCVKVFVNENFAGEHKGGYTAFSFEITDFIFYGKENVICLEVDSSERKEVPPFGGSIDYLTYGGVYRDVFLRVTDSALIKNVFIRTSNVLDENKKLNIQLQIESSECFDVKLEFELSDINGAVIRNSSQTVKLNSGINGFFFCIDNLQNIKLWDVDFPNLYFVKINLVNNKIVEDSVIERIGFRQAEFTAQGFFLNGKRITIRGLNRHQSFPYAGYAMPKRIQRHDAEILKNELGINFVRTSHYPQSVHFLDACDELGLLVFEEMPGWNYIGDEEWQDNACTALAEMILKDRNHPSIILWGTRINESDDNDIFYKRTVEIARTLDGSRQTGGVRCIANSKLLEDVYTMNDFVFGLKQNSIWNMKDETAFLRRQKEVTGLETYVPYLVTEFGGHMYPVKIFDQEERLIEQALLHMFVHNTAALSETICGTVGWCAFDYNTHYEFGSGDRICYHGVMDMFRLPKYAAFFYKSQMPPEKNTVLEPLTRWTVGERGGGGVSPLIICTNCEAVGLKTGGKDYGMFYPAKETFPGLEHPPVIIENIKADWGGSWRDAEFTGFINGKAVITVKRAAAPVPSQLYLKADDEVLSASEADCTRCVIKLLDQYGAEMHFAYDVVTLEIDGACEIIGKKIFALTGGRSCFWIKTVFTKTEIKIKASIGTLVSETITVSVE